MDQRPYVLIAEDDLFHAEVYKSKLTKSGYEVAIADNGKKAIELARKRLPDILVLDLIMPVKDGFDTLKEWNGDPDLKNIKVLVVTNMGQEEDIKKAMQLGAADYMIKSDFSIQDITNRIAQLIKATG